MYRNNSDRKRLAYAALLLFLAFLFLTGVVFAKWSTLIEFDQTVIAFLVGSRVPWLTSIALWATHFGEFSVIATLGAIAAVLLVLRRHYLHKTFLITFFGSALSFFVIKLLIERVRPEDTLPGYSAGFSSFPSGHTTMSAALYGSLAIVLAHHTPPRFRPLVYAGAVLLVLLISWSRMYLGVHYPTDILGALLLGAFWIVMGKLSSHKK